ncbi:YggS family pyridoxal phosphate-dependent enzyme [Kovacikia minuta CCNUW1]|uniref:YggS family pyridoxal phosphate-dependent enzyme n=1 Tax=Kovacikia minuta TaxID=2931930 RepID=UPI001CC91C68|nr:YggS family pyridoxal phosphate-dependent enzyme [Kovacikia minuta]UBF26629.1 YggS family pyridoxal phosphate-dependent enzyme [Kovacikia minuta CCNUW1]
MTLFSQLGGTISERISQIRQTVPDSVRLIAVTKQVSIAAMRQAYAAGIRDFGESRIQEAEAKQAQLQDLLDVTWHLIGHLQSNKAQRALEKFQWIHSIDTLKLAQRLNQFAAQASHRPKVLLQVKLLPDPNKYGWEVSDLLEDLLELNRCESLSIEGLMTILPQNLNPSESLEVFQQTKELASRIEQLNFAHIRMGQISMGMSGDYTSAVQAGATMIRLGRILFGDREA